MAEPFEDNWDYLSAELEALNSRLRREVARLRQAGPPDRPDVFKGVFISDGEIDHLVEQMSGGEAGTGGAAPQAPDEEAAALLADIAERRRAALARGTYLSLPHLAHLFNLSAFEERLLLLCLAPELDLRYEKFFAYLQDDVSRKRPNVGLALDLLCASSAERLQARALFSPQAPLFRSRLVSFHDDGDTHLLARGLKLDERIVNFLLGTAGLDKQLSACFVPVRPFPGLQSLRWPDELKRQLLGVTGDYLQHMPAGARKLIYNFAGPRGTGRKTLAAALCRELSVPLMFVDVREVLLRHQDFEDAVRRILREAVLQPGAIFLDHFDRLLEDDERADSNRRLLARAIEEFSWLTFLGTQKTWEPSGLFAEHLFLQVELPMPDAGVRARLWESLVGGEDAALAPGADWDELAVKFRLTPGQMRDALTTAHNRARLRGEERPVITPADLHAGCRAQSNQRLAAAARKLSPRHSWADITLPPNELAQLREMCAQLRHRRTVYGSWGFGLKHSLGKGLCALFYGPSGTGKTMAVEIIANELGLEAYKVDLSTVVSKYIGETEKNLSAIFHEAETSNAVLFFDEADALFGKRSEVKDAHDRYANIEINYLLQRMEEFEGLVILATNLRKNIDEAFFRRMHFAVEFPFPDEGQRYLIWRQHFPAAAPVADDIDFNFLAGRLKVAGGNIKNIVVNAAFLAAENSGVIGMKHLIRATRREYEKIGRLCTEAEFDPYHPLLAEHGGAKGGGGDETTADGVR